MSKIRKPTALIPLPSAYVRACLARVGLQGGALGTGRPATLTAYPTHALLDYAVRGALRRLCRVCRAAR